MKSIILALIVISTHCSNKSISLQGVWINKEDKLSSIKFDKDMFYQMYEGKIVSSEKYIRQTTSCDPTYYKGKDPKDFINVINSECYEITGLSDSLLAYRHTVSGKLLVFNKKY